MTFAPILLAALLATSSASAEGFNALARILPSQTLSEAQGEGVTVQLGISQPVPWRVYTLEAPRRVIVEFREVDWDGLDPARFPGVDVATGSVAGWSRLELTIDRPYQIAHAEMETEAVDGALVTLALAPTTPDLFSLSARIEETGPAPVPLRAPWRRQSGDRPLVVVLDPGHGGNDPGAEHQGTRESDLMLSFARELKEELLRTEGFRVVLTREEDKFVRLDRRVDIARQAGADVFLSLHADALAEGQASGATVYTLSASGAARAHAHLAERGADPDMIAGVDLEGQADAIAKVLFDLARRETDPRSDRLAAALVDGIRA